MPSDLTTAERDLYQKLKTLRTDSPRAYLGSQGVDVIRFEKFTVKAQEAVQAAQSLADQHNHQSVEPEHLLLALLQQREGVVGPVLAKLGGRPDVIQRALQQELERLPKVRGGGGQQYIGERLRAAAERAQS